MAHFQRIPTLIRSALASLLILALVASRDLLTPVFEGQQAYVASGTWAAFTLALYGVERAALWLLRHLRSLRGLINGRDDIEGDWVDVSRGPDGRLHYISLQTIAYERDGLVLHGIDWKPNGDLAQMFTTDSCIYRDRRLRFIYEQKGGLVVGCGELTFAADEGRAQRYMGWVLDADHTWRPELQGVRVRYGLKRRRPRTVEGKWQAALTEYRAHLASPADAREAGVPRA